VKKENIMITNGADQAIDLIFRTFTALDEEVIIPSPSFAMFYQCAKLCQNKIITPTYDASTGNFPLDEVMKSITPKTKLIVICNPNNPTGTLVSLETIEKILKKTSGLVMTDEAYIEYADCSASKLIDKYKNLPGNRK